MKWWLPVVVKHKTMPQFWKVEKENKWIQAMLWIWTERRLRTDRRCGFFLPCHMNTTKTCIAKCPLKENHGDRGVITLHNDNKTTTMFPMNKCSIRTRKVFFLNLSTSKLSKNVVPLVQVSPGPLLESLLLQFKSLTDYANYTDSTDEMSKWDCASLPGVPM